MTRIIVYLVGAIVALVLAWFLLAALLHTLMFYFWIVVVVLLAFGMFRLGRRSGRRAGE